MGTQHLGPGPTAIPPLADGPEGVVDPVNWGGHRCGQEGRRTLGRNGCCDGVEGFGGSFHGIVAARPVDVDIDEAGGKVKSLAVNYHIVFIWYLTINTSNALVLNGYGS